MFYVLCTCIWNLHEGMLVISAFTILFIPKLAKLPRITPLVKATYIGACSKYWLLLDILVKKRKLLSCNTYTPWWFVRRLSICFLYTADQKSVQMNFIVSSSSLNLGISLVNLQRINSVVCYWWITVTYVCKRTSFCFGMDPSLWPRE